MVPCEGGRQQLRGVEPGGELVGHEDTRVEESPCEQAEGNPPPRRGLVILGEGGQQQLQREELAEELVGEGEVHDHPQQVRVLLEHVLLILLDADLVGEDPGIPEQSGEESL